MTTVSARMRSNRKPRPADQELARLAESLSLSRNGGFALLSYDTVEQRTQWLEALRARLEPADFHSPPLPEDGIGLVPQIAEISSRSGFATQPLTVLVVEGIEALDMAARQRLVINLNLMRTRLSETAYPLLFCADSTVLDQFIHDAPDLFDRIGLWADLRGQVPPAIARPPAMSVDEQYRTTLIRRQRQVEFRGILSINKPVTLPLTDFYVPLQATQTVTNHIASFYEEIDRMRMRERALRAPKDILLPSPPFKQEPRELAIADAVRDNRMLVVLGDPGAGKSTLLRYVALAAAEGAPERAGLPAHPNGWLPLLIPCSAIADALSTEAGGSVLDIIVRYVEQQYEMSGFSDVMQDAIIAGRALLLFDGLDEIADDYGRGNAARAIDQALRGWTANGNRAIVSSRVVGYGTAPVRSADAVATLRDFDEPRIGEFLRGWCVAYERFARGNIPEVERDGIKQAVQLVAEINTNAGARRLAGNPLLLTIMALIQRQGVRMPERRVELYDIAARTLIETWNRARGLSDVALLNLPDPRLTATLLGEVALWMQHRETTTATTTELLPMLAEAHRRRSSPEPEAAAAAFLHDVQHYSGLLVERGPDAYSFLHLTFQEYFAARALASISDPELRWRHIAPHLHDPRWRETILLTTGELGVRIGREDEVTGLVRQILTSITPPSKLTIWKFKHRFWPLLSATDVDQIQEHYLKRQLILAGQILADDVGVEQEITQQIIQLLIQLVSSKIDMQREEALVALSKLPKRLREETVIPHLLDALCVPEWDVRCRTALALGYLGLASPEVMAALRSARSDPTVYEHAARMLKQLEQASSRISIPLTTTVQNSDRAEREKEKEAQEHHDATLAVSSTLRNALRDRKDEVRAAAALAIKQIEQVPGYLAALSESDAEKRAAAYRGIKQTYQETPEVINALITALRALDADVRISAAKALGELGERTSEVTTALINALLDSTRGVRRWAAWALGQLGQATPEVVDALLVALHDPADTVRGEVANALGRLGQATPEVIAALTSAIRDSEWSVRLSATSALGQFTQASSEVSRIIQVALRDPSMFVRRMASRILWNFGVHTREVRLELLSALAEFPDISDKAYCALTGNELLDATDSST